jgi:hypothetical protein
MKSTKNRIMKRISSTLLTTTLALMIFNPALASPDPSITTANATWYISTSTAKFEIYCQAYSTAPTLNHWVYGYVTVGCKNSSALTILRPDAPQPQITSVNADWKLWKQGASTAFAQGKQYIFTAKNFNGYTGYTTTFEALPNFCIPLKKYTYFSESSVNFSVYSPTARLTKTFTLKVFSPTRSLSASLYNCV